jgi:hypothetical protein
MTQVATPPTAVVLLESANVRDAHVQRVSHVVGRCGAYYGNVPSAPLGGGML